MTDQHDYSAHRNHSRRMRLMAVMSFVLAVIVACITVALARDNGLVELIGGTVILVLFGLVVYFLSTASTDSAMAWQQWKEKRKPPEPPQGR